jgi:hypothetical protein
MGWRTSDGRHFSGSYESWIDRQIREAEERGEFDDLPGAGKPLEHLGAPDDPEWWIKRLVAREQLDLSAALPPQLALRKEAQHLPERALELPSEQAVRELAEDFNVRVRDCWRRPLEGPPVVVRTVDPEELVAHWRANRPRPAIMRAESPPAENVPLGRRAPGWFSRVAARLRRRTSA